MTWTIPEPVWEALRLWVPASLSLAAFVFSIISFRKSRWSTLFDQRWTQTLELLKELNSVEFGNLRRDGREFVKANSNVDWNALHNPEKLPGEPDKVSGLFTVMRFYHRVSKLVERKRVIDEEIVDMFGDDFAFWHGFLFERMAGRTSWRTGPSIMWLAEWLEARMSTEDWRRGIQAGQKSYQDAAALLLAKANSTPI